MFLRLSYQLCIISSWDLSSDDGTAQLSEAFLNFAWFMKMH